MSVPARVCARVNCREGGNHKTANTGLKIVIHLLPPPLPFFFLFFFLVLEISGWDSCGLTFL